MLLSVDENYGAIAKRDIPAGTVLCFVEGVYFNRPSFQCAKHTRVNMIQVTDSSCVDMSDFYSCYARYYNRASKTTVANTYMIYVEQWADPNKAICCVSNADICRGAEIIVDKIIRRL